jgi:high-affinity iron transporter
VFLVSVLENSSSVTAGSVGAVLGITVSIAIGYGIYRGGVRLNLGRFFTVTGLVLVLVAAGLVMTTAHTAHEAGWLNIGQAEAIDLGWLVTPGTVVESLLTGVLGLRAHPTVIEVAGWLAYAIPMLVYVGRPRRQRPRPVRAKAPEAKAPEVAGQPAAGA